MKRGTIVISGAIGSFEYGGKQINGVKLIDVVSAVTNLGQIDELLIQIESMGGRKDVGDQIYNYLNSLKPTVKIITEQIGEIASIGTKIFGVGDERIALQGEAFMIHNPWTVAQGDSNTMAQVASDLKVAEDELRAFYKQVTGISDEGLAPLLDAETTFDADTALKLKFATQIKEPLKAVAMKLETKKKMNGVLNALMNFLNNSTDVLAMVVELEGGSKIAVATEDASNLEGVSVFIVDEAGNPTQEPAPDGEHKLADGRVITVQGGVIASVAVPSQPPAPEEAQVDVVLSANLEKIAVALGSVSKLEEKILSAVEAKFTELRSQIKTQHTPMGYRSENHGDLLKEWERSFKANEHMAMKKNDPEKYKLLYFAKYGKVPNL
jgi:ATP-dependent protease ClpP protease subunit